MERRRTERARPLVTFNMREARRNKLLIEPAFKGSCQ